jgi:hypothetical protein
LAFGGGAVLDFGDDVEVAERQRHDRLVEIGLNE